MPALHAAILAGGSGTRFWPLSRRNRPKQFLRLAGAETLIAATRSRLGADIGDDRVLVVCGRRHTDAVRVALPALPAENVVAEPFGRNTAAAVGLAALWVAQRDPEGVLAILPADHFVRDSAGFRAALETAAELAAEGDIVTLGITPTRPETGYGYIEVGETLGDERAGHRVASFREKPTRERAEAMLSSGNFLWNGGIFVFRADVMRAELARHLPGVSTPLESLAGKLSDDAAMDAAWNEMESISIDHGVMEKTDRAAVIPLDVGWSDVGSFGALPEVVPADDAGNVLLGDAATIRAEGNVVHSDAGRLVVLVDVDDLVVVDSGDAVLVCRRDRSQAVRDVVDHLGQTGREELL